MRYLLLSVLFLQFGLMFSPIGRAEGYEPGQDWHAGNNMPDAIGCINANQAPTGVKALMHTP